VVRIAWQGRSFEVLSLSIIHEVEKQWKKMEMGAHLFTTTAADIQQILSEGILKFFLQDLTNGFVKRGQVRIVII
jgi:hypothetical protein